MKAIVASLLALLTAATGAVALAPAIKENEAEQTWLYLGEELNLETGVVRQVQKIVTQGELDHTASCGGFAPQTTSCVISHTPYFFFASHGFFLPSQCGTEAGNPIPIPNSRCFVSHVRSALSPGSRVFTCDLSNIRINGNNIVGPTISCSGSGAFPGPGVSWTQTCSSNLIVAGNDLPAPDGVGDWRCQSFHF